MKVKFHRNFEKLYDKLPDKIQRRFEERLLIFVGNASDPTLRDHSLTGEWQGCRSINVTGDYRALYETLDEETVIFVAIGTHSQLYR